MVHGEPVAVTVVIAGRRIDASAGAEIVDGIVIAPLDPFVRDFAERIEVDGTGRRVVVWRGDRSFAVTIAETLAGVRFAATPNVDEDALYVPLAPIVRALGGSAEYAPGARTLSIAFVPTPVATMTPLAGYVPAPGPLPTFTAKPTPAPQPTVTGIPHPRRTPIVVEP